MKYPNNIRSLIKLRPDFIGFIFYPKSPRFAEPLDKSILKAVPPEVSKVGVFVNEPLTELVSTVDKYKLNYVQLHGDEDASYAANLKEHSIKIIKVFRISDSLPTDLYQFEDVADYFLFDTATTDYGGSGKQFSWDVLSDLETSTPFLLSGGIRLEDVAAVKQLSLDSFAGVDVNSKFEISPGIKDIELIEKLKQAL